jgi:hypothetical protein
MKVKAYLIKSSRVVSHMNLLKITDLSGTVPGPYDRDTDGP